MRARIESVNTSRGGVPKLSVFEDVVTAVGLATDHQNDPRYHGGPERAVVLFSLDLIRQLQGEGHPIAPGTTGENLTVSGLDWRTLGPGTELLIGEQVRLQVTKYATPCAKIRASFLQHDYTRIAQDQHPGWSRLCARVLAGGSVRPGDAVVAVRGTSL